MCWRVNLEDLEISNIYENLISDLSKVYSSIKQEAKNTEIKK